EREKIEIRDGGFGRGEVRDAYVDLEDGDGYEDDAIKMKDGNADIVKFCKQINAGHIMKIESLIDWIVEKKDVLDKYIVDACSKFPNDDKTNVSSSEGNKGQCGVNDNVVVPESSKESSKVNTTVGMMDNKKSDGVENVEHSDNVNKGKSDTEDDEMGVKEVNLCKPLDDEEKLVWQYLLTTVVDKERVDSKKDVSESIDIALEKGEVAMSFMKNIFETEHRLTTMTYLITSLKEGKEVEANVIDCWAAILNFNERKLKTEGKRRLCCYTTTIRQTKEKAFGTMMSRLR
ncbi:hypothetical protein M8C21_020888, partial [Ambrosia artemisiifolia]